MLDLSASQHGAGSNPVLLPIRVRQNPQSQPTPGSSALLVSASAPTLLAPRPRPGAAEQQTVMPHQQMSETERKGRRHLLTAAAIVIIVDLWVILVYSLS